jgi:hypothetical protein
VGHRGRKLAANHCKKHQQGGRLTGRRAIRYDNVSDLPAGSPVRHPAVPGIRHYAPSPPPTTFACRPAGETRVKLNIRPAALGRISQLRVQVPPLPDHPVSAAGMKSPQRLCNLCKILF